MNELILWMCKLCAQMNEIHICMNTLFVHSTFSRENHKFDLDKSKQTINGAALAVWVRASVRWEIMKSDHFSFDFIKLAFFPFMMRHFRVERRDKNEQNTVINCVHHRPTCDHPMCSILKRMPACARVTVFSSSLKTHTNHNKLTSNWKKAKINKAHLCSFHKTNTKPSPIFEMSPAKLMCEHPND